MVTNKKPVAKKTVIHRIKTKKPAPKKAVSKINTAKFIKDFAALCHKVDDKTFFIMVQIAIQEMIRRTEEACECTCI